MTLVGDLVIVVEDFMGEDKVGIFDIFLKDMPAKCYAVRRGKLYFGEIYMGKLAYICNSAGVFDKQISSMCAGKSVIIIPARDR